jgi:predicted metal-dependent phosphoesterase TrpH
VKIVKNERDPPLLTGKLLIKFQNILRNTTQAIISVSQNVLKFYQQLAGEERRIPSIFDDFHFCCSRVIGLDMTKNMIFTVCRMIT